MTRRIRVMLAGLACVASVSAFVVLAAAAPAAAVTVTTETGFRTAWSAGTTPIDLGNDITLTCTSVGGDGVAATTAATSIVVNGNGHTITQTCPTGTNNGVLEQDGVGGLTFNEITITGGSALFSGGGILASAPVTLTNSTVRDNHADNPGGVHGGGIQSPSVTLTNSTVSGNTAFGEGGINIEGSSLTLVYSTVVGNTALGSGSNPANLGRVSVGTTTLTAFGSVVALPLGTSRPNCANITTTSNGFNFSDDNSCGLTAGTDKQNAGDPGLGALAANGGPTLTRLSQAGSPLIDAIPLASCQADGATGITTDQRGVTRPQGSGCDIGAVEAQVAVPTPVAPTPAAPTPVVITPTFTG